MGCERVRETNTGSGVRASMERRWLVNARSTVMRQRKWQEIRMQKELEEQRKKAEILERRRREHARLAAYIHSTVQPVIKCATNPKLPRNDHKRLNWNMCLQRDQEHILRLRENVKAIAENVQRRRYYSSTVPVPGLQSPPQPGGLRHHSSKESSDSDQAMQASVLSRSEISENICFKEDTCRSDKFLQLQMSTAQAERDAESPFFTAHNDSSNSLAKLPAKCPAKCEIAVNTSATWSPNIMTWEAKLAEDLASTSILRPSKPSTASTENLSEQPNGIHPTTSLEVNLEHTELLSGVEQGVSCATQAESVDQQDSSLKALNCEHEEPTLKISDCDLREEILRARLANEAATARLIAEVTAIESRLEDCNLTMKSLDFGEGDRIFAMTDPLTDYNFGSTDPAQSGSAAEIEGSHLSDNKSESSQPSIPRAPEWADKENSTLFDWRHASQNGHNELPFLSNPEAAPYEIDWDTGTFSSLNNKAADLECTGQGKIYLEKPKTTIQASEKRERFDTPVFLEPAEMVISRTAGAKLVCTDLDNVVMNIPHTSYKQAKRRIETSPKLEQQVKTDGRTGAMSSAGPDMHDQKMFLRGLNITECCSEEPSVRPSSPAMKQTESSSAWDINWDPVPSVFPAIESEWAQNMQSGSGTASTSLFSGNCGSKKHFKRSLDEKSRFHCATDCRQEADHNLPNGAKFGRIRPQAIPLKQICGHHYQNMREDPMLRSKCVNIDATDPLQITTLTTTSPHLGDSHLGQNIFQAPSSLESAGPSRLLSSPQWHKDEKYYHDNEARHLTSFSGNDRSSGQIQSSSVTVEEQNIFASLERLDWKLAAISKRCLTVGRESVVSHGQCSTMSAPAVMGQVLTQILDNGNMIPCMKKPIAYSTLPPRPLVSFYALLADPQSRSQLGDVHELLKKFGLNL